MVMDVGRTCGKARVRFFQNSALEIPIRWYRCPPGAKVFPGYSRFGLGYWAYDKTDTPGIGQVEPHNLAYDKGLTLLTANGQQFCGKLSDYADGLVYPPAGPPVQYDVNGIPTCCPGSGPPVPEPPLPVEDDVRDINFWRQVLGNGLDVWYTGGSVTGQGQSPVLAEADTVHCLPFFAARGGSLSNLGVWLETVGSVGAKLRLAIYEASTETDLRPARLIVDGGELDAHTGAGAWLDVPINVTLDHLKLYWLCLVAKGVAAMPVVGAMTSVFYFNLLGFSATSFTPYFGFKVPLPFGAFPALFPNVDNSHLANSSIMAAGVKYSA